MLIFHNTFLLLFTSYRRLRILPGGKGGRCVGLTTLPPSCSVCFEIWVSQPSGTLWACPGL